MTIKKNNIDFGLQPISNRFLESNLEISPSFPLEISWDSKLGCPVLLKPWPIEEIRPQFDWITCFEPEDHLDDLCNIILKLKINKDKATIAGYSFKDDTTLARLNKLGFNKQWRIDPKNDLSILNPLSNIETLQSSFNTLSANIIAQKKGLVDVLLVRHVIEHAYDLTDFINALKLLIKDDGYIVFELPDCKKAFKGGDCTTIWEEHTYYFFESSFKRCMHINNLEIVFWKNWDYPLENCMVGIVRKYNKKNTNIFISNKSNEDLNIYNSFIDKFQKRKRKITAILNKFTQENGKICILGAGHLTIAFISLLNISEFISFAIDDNENKLDYFLPIGNIPIKKTEFLNSTNIKLCLLGANPQHHAKIKNNLQTFQNNGGIICSIFPNTLDYIEDTL